MALPIDYRLDKVDLIETLDKLGFSNISTVSIGENFYGMVAEK